jgi:hypothetical protein
MLPSFRLIAATFFGGFLVVYGGLRLATSLNDFHEALPVMAAQAAPVAVAQLERGGAGPVSYDLRFAVSSATKSPPLNVTALVIDRTAPLVAPPPVSPAEPVAAPAAETADVSAADAVDPAKPVEAPAAGESSEP